MRHSGWPALLVQAGLLFILAADAATKSPMRLAEAGPWWDQADGQATAYEREFSEWSAQFDEFDGRRPALRAQARAELEIEHIFKVTLLPP